MAHIAHQPGPVCLEGGVSRWLVGVVGLGAELHPRPHSTRRVGRFFNSSGLVKRAVPAADGLAGMAELRALVPAFARGGDGGDKPLLFAPNKPCQMFHQIAFVFHPRY